jgi:hypothetical protein
MLSSNTSKNKFMVYARGDLSGGRAIENANSQNVSKFLYEVICRHGCPRRIVIIVMGRLAENRDLTQDPIYGVRS